jgi:hypothetical protein
MSTKQLDYFNIFLMLISYILALKLPFEMFLLAYAVLGPLHYVTEISWLDQKSYFLRTKKDFWILAIICTILFFIVLYSYLYQTEWMQGILATFEATTITAFNEIINPWGSNLVFIGFATALILFLVEKTIWRLILIATCVALSVFIQSFDSYSTIFGVFLPTIIHVCLFTGIFILVGALRNNQFSGYLSIICYIGFLIAILFLNHKFVGYQISDYVQESFINSGFGAVSVKVMELLKPLKEGEKYYLMSPLGLKVQAFVAFVYTYHYLNWFSKTDIIGWTRVPKRQLYTGIAIWIAALALYAYNYKAGLIGLLFLSMLHVFLEFPLNHKSFIDLGTLLRQRLTGKTA